MKGIFVKNQYDSKEFLERLFTNRNEKMCGKITSYTVARVMEKLGFISPYKTEDISWSHKDDLTRLMEEIGCTSKGLDNGECYIFNVSCEELEFLVVGSGEFHRRHLSTKFINEHYAAIVKDFYNEMGVINFISKFRGNNKYKFLELLDLYDSIEVQPSNVGYVVTLFGQVIEEKLTSRSKVVRDKLFNSDGALLFD